MSIQGTMPKFEELVALCITKEVKLGLNVSGSGSSHANQVFYHQGQGMSRGHSYQSNRGRFGYGKSPSTYGKSYNQGESMFRDRGRFLIRGC